MGDAKRDGDLLLQMDQELARTKAWRAEQEQQHAAEMLKADLWYRSMGFKSWGDFEAYRRRECRREIGAMIAITAFLLLLTGLALWLVLMFV